MIHAKTDTRERASKKGFSIASAEAAFLLVFPILSYLILRPSPINQAGTLDPYIYTGYIHNIEDLLARYHLTYYSVRFGLILPARLFSLVFGFEKGYLIFRYALALLAGIPLYLLTKRHFGLPFALAAYAILLTSPFLGRSLFWDYPDAAAVPYLLASLSLFVLTPRPLWGWDTIVGFLFGLAVHSNFFTISIVGLFVASAVLACLVDGDSLLFLIQRFLFIFAGAVIATIVGVLYYYHLAGIWNIFSPSIDMALWLSRGGMQRWRTPNPAWIASNIHVLVLPLVAAGSVFALFLRKRSAGLSIVSIYAIAVAIYYYLYQFAFNADVLELKYYFAYCLPALFLAIPVILDTLWARVERSNRTWLAIVTAAGFIGPWLLVPYPFDWQPSAPLVKFGILSVVLAVFFVLCARVQMQRKPLLATVTVTTLLFGSVFDFGFLGAGYGHLFHLKASKTERDVYRVAEQFMSVVPKFKDRPGILRFWYNNRPGNFANSVQSTYLWGYSRCNLVAADDPGMPYIGPFELGLFTDKALKYVVLIGETENENDKGMTALRKGAIPYTTIDHRLLSSGDYRIYVDTLQLLDR